MGTRGTCASANEVLNIPAVRLMYSPWGTRAGSRVGTDGKPDEGPAVGRPAVCCWTAA